jgi:hypothetical protein
MKAADAVQGPQLALEERHVLLTAELDEWSGTVEVGWEVDGMVPRGFLSCVCVVNQQKKTTYTFKKLYIYIICISKDVVNPIIYAQFQKPSTHHPQKLNSPFSHLGGQVTLHFLFQPPRLQVHELFGPIFEGVDGTIVCLGRHGICLPLPMGGWGDGRTRGTTNGQKAPFKVNSKHELIIMVQYSTLINNHDIMVQYIDQ